MGKEKKDLKVVRKSIDDTHSYLYKITDRLYFLWEFLRRNETYIEAYQRFSENKDYWLEPVYDPPRNKNEDDVEWHEITNGGRVYHRYKELFNPFGIEEPLDPSIPSCDPAFKEIGTSLYHYVRWFNKSVFHYSLPKSKPLAKKQELRDWKRLHKDSLEIHIDLTASIDKILDDVKNSIKKAKRNISSKLQQQRQEWSEYIISYDLKKAEYSVQDIGKILYPNDEHKPLGPNSCFSDCPVCRKVNRNIKRAEGLINQASIIPAKIL